MEQQNSINWGNELLGALKQWGNTAIGGLVGNNGGGQVTQPVPVATQSQAMPAWAKYGLIAVGGLVAVLVILKIAK